MDKPTFVILAFFIFFTLLAGPQAYRNWREARKKRE